MTHDSIGLGEDGPTHQPVETLALTRATPNMLTLRPADGNEVSGAYWVALQNKERPSVLALSRQGLPQLEGSSPESVHKGGYVLQTDDKPQIIFVATGSEVTIAVDSHKKLKEQGIPSRVVSMPCTELFDEQPIEYKKQVIPSGTPVISIEALGTFGWDRYSHAHIGLHTFGTCGKVGDVYKHFVINELFGDQSKFPSQREHLPHIVLGTPKRSRLLQKQEDREKLVESQKIHENIPVKSNDQENQDEKHIVGQGVLEKTKNLSNGKRDVLSENVIKTSTSTSSVNSSTSISSDSSNISTSSGSSSNSDSNTNSGSNVSDSSSGISEHSESIGDTISSNNHNNNRANNDHKGYELIDDLSTSSSTIDTSTSTSTVNTNTSDIISKLRLHTPLFLVSEKKTANWPKRVPANHC
ncbi:Putative Transketolase [Rhizopus microsporus]|nr:Putative Transketolase [Rhizopus microsporus]